MSLKKNVKKQTEAYTETPVSRAQDETKGRWSCEAAVLCHNAACYWIDKQPASHAYI